MQVRITQKEATNSVFVKEGERKGELRANVIGSKMELKSIPDKTDKLALRATARDKQEADVAKHRGCAPNPNSDAHPGSPTVPTPSARDPALPRHPHSPVSELSGGGGVYGDGAGAGATDSGGRFAPHELDGTDASISLATELDDRGQPMLR